MAIEMAVKYLFLPIIVIITANYCSSLADSARDTLRLGASLAENKTLLSSNGTFALGFFNPSGTNNWYIGIWYASLNQKTNVWVANRDNPLTNMPGVLQLSNDGHVRLLDGQSQSVWSTDNAEKGSRAVLTDSGNFIILGAHNELKIVWESFANPTNTLLPGMKMWKGMKLTSWKSSSDPATGLFSFGMDTSPGKTQMMMFFNNNAPYWSSGEFAGGHKVFSKIPESEGKMKIQVSCVTLFPSRIYILFRVNPSDDMVTGRLLLNEKGEFEIYFWRDGAWSLFHTTYRGQCSDYQICGAYGLCNLNDVCSCIQGFTPKHDSHGWWPSGCARRKPLKCSVTEGTTDDFLEAENQYMPEKEAV